MLKKATEPNRLAKEKSPYLLQHALNPVDWYPWSGEAFAKAQKEDKPIFLSIGYSTCHWCHVMEKESFEDETVAKLLNENFVSIKVDREERPDIDSIYMKACMLISGSGGWPLTIIMTPDKQPFFAGTYFPKTTKGGMPGLVDLLSNVAGLWKKERHKLTGPAKKITEYLTKYGKERRQGEELTELAFDEAFIRLLDSFDRTNGGFGTRPKFPSPHNLLFLLRYWKRKATQQALEMVEKTLHNMRLGGVFDQVGFGFHRYSTDSTWLVPHFEKMLYDQALMSIAYIEAYQATGKAEYQKAAEELFEYITRDMTSPEGGFFSAEGADTEGQEGKFYLWTETEIRNTLCEHADIAIKAFNVTKEGNYHDEVKQAKTGNNILHFKKSQRELSAEMRIDLKELATTLDTVIGQLLKSRKNRIPPLKDTKILTDWNGLMIAAFAKGARVFDSIEYAEVAEEAVKFILEKLRADYGRLFHRYKDGEAAIDGYLDDYAFLIWGLIEMYETTFDTIFLEEALRLQDTMVKHFLDKETGSFFFTADVSEKLLIRYKGFRDGAIPSGNSVALLNLIRLSRMTGKIDYEEKAASLARAISSHEEGTPSHNTMFLTALDFLIGPTHEIAIVGNPNSKETKNMLQAIRSKFLPNKVVLLKKNQKGLQNLADFTRDMRMVDNKTTAYICRNFVCSKPTTEIQEVMEMLAKLNIA